MPDDASINVFYDAVCPGCRKDRRRFERWAGHRAQGIKWCDVSEHQQLLRQKGVAPEAALRSLHIEKADGRMIEGIDAYRLLMARIPVLLPVAWIIGLPGIKSGLRWYYDCWVKQRLKREGRWSE
ncbi:thiol-disulfide oxidoreductase DCC family protein [Vreelandella olivaria]|uniref:thiol-disulfide oxidoreductase DCC family protein n=1 Tax=Vreelandella olivaria TaxID=390919 RepID=UPI00201EB4F2|nr:DCC1-like thiol-disulfide oxidoreductase family protein [Halomonas olivaria]